MRPLATMVLLLAGLAHTTAVFAQASPSAPTPKRDQPLFVLGIEGKYGAPQRSAGGLALYIPTEKWHCEDGLCGGVGLEVQGSVGTGGQRLAAGFVGMAFPYWQDVLATVTRTSASPRRAGADSTYVGVEGGLAFPVYATHYPFVSVRPSVGVAHRVNGAAGPKATTFTWGIGVNLMLSKF